MEGQLSLFPEEQKLPAKIKQKKEKKNIDPAQTFDERMKRFWHYMETKGMHEQWIETVVGELRIIIDALADYHDIVSGRVGLMEDPYAKAAWEYQLKRIKQIQGKLEESVGYNRDEQLETCKKRRHSNDGDIGEDALVLASRG